MCGGGGGGDGGDSDHLCCHHSCRGHPTGILTEPRLHTCLWIPQARRATRVAPDQTETCSNLATPTPCPFLSCLLPLLHKTCSDRLQLQTSGGVASPHSPSLAATTGTASWARRRRRPRTSHLCSSPPLAASGILPAPPRTALELPLPPPLEVASGNTAPCAKRLDGPLACSLKYAEFYIVDCSSAALLCSPSSPSPQFVISI